MTSVASASVTAAAAAAKQLRLRDLGPLTVRSGDAVSPVRGVSAQILSTLLINPNRRVSVDFLVMAVWGDGATIGGSTLEAHVWRLRKVLEPHRGRGQPPTYLVNDSHGYRLVVNPEDVDSLRFIQLTEQGDDLLARQDPVQAGRRYDAALALWRGTPYEAVADKEWSTGARSRLEELRGHAQEQRIEVLLRTGEYGRAVSELGELVQAMPFRERLWEQFMLGLYGLGRAADALDAYQRVRRLLLDDIGVEPGPGLREVQRRILDRDPTLRPVPPSPEPRSVQGHLPARLSPMIGRVDEVSRLRRLVAQRRLLTLVGSAGCGKTRLAIEVARGVTTSAPDGVWFIDLTVAEDPAAVIDVVAAALGVASSPVGGAAAAVRRFVEDQHVLLILDNCEHVLGSVRALVDGLLASAQDSRILATSREPIGIDGEVLWSLAPLPTRGDITDPDREPTQAADRSSSEKADQAISDAAELFISRAQMADPMFVVTDAEVATVETICTLVDGVPLAIELAAGRVRTASLDEICEQARTGLADLSRTGHSQLMHHQTIERSIEWSTRLLSENDRAAHARLSVLPGVFTKEAAAAVVPAGVSVGDAQRLLDRLVNSSLLGIVPAAAPGRPTRYRQLATVRAHAVRVLAASGHTDDVLRKRKVWLTEMVGERAFLLAEDSTGWHARVEDNYDTLNAVLQQTLIDAPEPDGLVITMHLHTFWLFRNRLLQGEKWVEAAHTLGGRWPEHRHLGLIAAFGRAYLAALRDRDDIAAAIVREALRDADQLDPVVLVTCLVGVAWSGSLRNRSQLAFVDEEILRRTAHGGPLLELHGRLAVLKATLTTGDPDDLCTEAEDLVELAMSRDDLMVGWLAGLLGMIAALGSANAHLVEAMMERARACYVRLGGTTDIAVEYEAHLAMLNGDLGQAVTLFGRARSQALRTGWPWPYFSDDTAAALTGLRQRLPVEDFERAWRAATGGPRDLQGSAWPLTQT